MNKNIFNIKRKSFLLIFTILILLGSVLFSSPNKLHAATSYIVFQGVTGGLTCTQNDQSDCNQFQNTTINQTQTMTGRNGGGVSGLGSHNSNVSDFDQNSINVPTGGKVTLSGNVNNLPSDVGSYSLNITCSGPTGNFNLQVQQSGTAWSANPPVPGNTACYMSINVKKDVNGNTPGISGCSGYMVASCSMGACVERPASSCDEASTCSQQYGCDTTVGVNVTPVSKTIAPGDTASYDVEITQNFMTSAPIYNIHLFSSMQTPGTSISWEIPSDQGGNVGFTNSGSTGNNVTVEMKAPKGTVRMNVKTDSSISLGSKSFYVTADTGSGPCYGKCTDTKNGLTLVVAPAMSGTLTPRTPGCEIARHASTCDVYFDWHVINPVVVGGSAVTKHPNVTVGTGDNRTNVPLAVGINGETFYLYNNAVKLAESTVMASDVKCVSGTTWDVNKGSCETPGPNTCPNGAKDFPACTVCPSGFTMTNGTCSPTVPPCPNGATNYPTCDNNPNPNPGSCANGATNPPACNTCGNGYSMIGGACTANAVMSGTLNAPVKCTIGLDESECDATLSWNTINPEAPLSAITSQYPTSNTTVATGNSGTKTLSIKHFASPQSFYLYNNNKILDQATVIADCIAGTVWDMGAQKCISNGMHNMTGALTPESDHCNIPLAGNSCTINFSWMTIYPEATSSVTSNVTDRGNPDPNRVLATGNNGGPEAFVIPYPSRDFYLYNNGKLLDQTIPSTITAVCTPGTAWSVVNNKCESTKPTDPTIPSLPPNGGGGGGNNGTSIGASPSTIYLSESTTLTWNSNAGSCTGTNFSTGGAKSGSITLSPQSTTTYTITCGGVSRSVTVIVKKKPGYIEQ